MRKVLFWLHLTTGSCAGAIILIMSVTGVLLAYKRQITDWADGGIRVASPTANAIRLPMETLMSDVAAQNLGATSGITLRSDPSAPVEVALGRERTLFVNPYTGVVMAEGSRSIRAFFEDIENVHRSLGAKQENRAAARAVTGACNFGFLILVVSGPFLWWPRKVSGQSIRQIVAFRRGLSGRARDFNWHNTIGIWCAAPLVVIVISGVVMSYPWANNLVYRLTGNPAPAQEDRGRQRPGGARAVSTTGWDVAWLRAERQTPGWQSITLRVPPSGRGPLTFSIDQGAGGRPDQRSQLTLDARTGDIVRWEPFSSYNSGRRLRSWLRFLHTGEAGGFTGQTIAAIASAGAVFLVWTGISLALRRLWRSRNAKKTKVGHATAAMEATPVER